MRVISNDTQLFGSGLKALSLFLLTSWSSDVLLAQCPAGGYPPPQPVGGQRGGAGVTSPGGPATPGPTGPATPSPGGPGAPVAGPATGGPGAGPGPRGVATAAPGAPGAGPRRGGMPLVFTHGRTAKELLEIDWDYPVYKLVDDSGAGSTVAKAKRQALSYEDAVAFLAGDDPRPLLVLRECLSCRGSDLALLRRELHNERTMLLTDWFHCIKLTPDVAERDHPFFALFQEGEHVFLANADGSDRQGFDGVQSQKALWGALGKQLKSNYRGNADRAVKQVLSLLVEFDKLDEAEDILVMQLDRALEKVGADAEKTRKLQREIERIGKKRAQWIAREREIRDLGIKTETR